MKTIFGVATTLGAVVRTRSATGNLAGYAVESYEPQLLGNDIDLDHDESLTVGTITYAEISPQGQLAIVGVVDMPLDEIEQDVFFSGRYYPDAPVDRRRSFLVDRAHMAGMSITYSPANSGARPLRWMHGDFRSSSVRYQWPMSWQSDAPLVQRALDHLGEGTRERSATWIVDRRSDAGSDYPWEQLPLSARRAIGDRDREQASGQLRHSAHAGRILSVR